VQRQTGCRDLFVGSAFIARFVWRYPHIILLDLCQFCGNRRREGRTFVTSVSAIACTDVPVHRAAVWALRLAVYRPAVRFVAEFVSQWKTSQVRYSFKPLNQVKDFHKISYYKHLFIKGHPRALSSLWVLRHEKLYCDTRSSPKIYNCSDRYSVVKNVLF
jgi:hypothetical protein